MPNAVSAWWAKKTRKSSMTTMSLGPDDVNVDEVDVSNLSIAAQPTEASNTLCPVCETLFNGAVGSHAKDFPHHESVDSLYRGRDLGCRVCLLIWKRTTPAQRKYMDERKGEGETKLALSRTHHYYGHMTRDDAYKNYHVIVEVFQRGEPVEEIRIDLGLEPVDRLVEAESHREVVHKTPVEALDVALAWYTRCRRKHVDCRRSRPDGSYRGPSRLVDVAMSDPLLWRIREVGELGIDELEYFTLSHCWGKSPILTLTVSTIEAMRSGMPLSRLSQTFRDAIYITRRLGGRYLWIDSLCIMQDSKSDWERESARMRDVYLYSACTIAATGSSDSNGGCLAPRSQELPDELWTVKAGPWAHNREYIVLDVHKLAAQIRDAPLSTRAWVVQERLLSPRTLHMAQQQLFWECDGGLACELWPRAVPRAFEDYFGAMFRHIHGELVKLRRVSSDTGDLSLMYRLWEDVVDRYTACHLTKPSDKLIAISGIAQLFQSVLPNDTYLFGLWERDLAHGLLWRAADNGRARLVEVPGRAPTWSWASLDGHVEPQGRKLVINAEEILVHEIEVTTRAETAATPTATAIELTGTLFECNWEQSIEYPKSPGGAFKLLSGKVESIKGLFYPDTIPRSVFASQSFFCLSVLDFVWRQTRMLSGLVLLPIDESRTVFTRAGNWSTPLAEVEPDTWEFGRILDRPRAVGRADPDARWQRLTII
jgi:hypothetical protein